MCRSVFPEQFRVLRDRQNTVVLDVRSPKEKYEEGSIPGHELIDFNNPNFSYQLDELDRSKTYLVYCRSGNRSQQACSLMQRKGFHNVISLEGGMDRWKATFSR